MQVGKSYATPREALLLNAKFVAAQFGKLDNKATAGSAKFSELPFTASLIKEVSARHEGTLPLVCPGATPQDARWHASCSHQMQFDRRGHHFLQSRALAQQLKDGRAGGPMTISEPGQAAPDGGAAAQQNGGDKGGEQMETDEDFARQLQAKMDAEEARRGCTS